MATETQRPRFAGGHTTHGDPAFSTETRWWRVPGANYLAMEHYGKYAPHGRHRWLFLGERVVVGYGPEGGIGEGLPDGVTRCRWLRGGRRALVVCIVAEEDTHAR